MSEWAGRLKRFGVLFGLGLLGILALVAEELRTGRTPEGLVISAVFLAVLLGILVAVGLYTAPRLGFRSHILNRITDGTSLVRAIQSELNLALGVGAALGIFIGVIETVIQPEILNGERSKMTVDYLVASLPGRLLHGGIMEELLMRWGVMSFVAFLLWKTVGRRQDSPSAGVIWTAILVAAVLFGVLHLPDVVATHGFTTELIALVVLGNGLPGVVFGWLFWRYSLEAAMIAHAFAHLVFVVGASLVLLFL